MSPPTGRRTLRGDLNGAFGDLGTFLPYVVGAITVGGLGAAGVLFGFGVALISCGLFYGLPMAVQPMKAVAAALLTSSLTPGEVAMAGMLLGVLFLVLGVTGGVSRIARAIPRSVTLGLVLGLGLSMAWLGAGLVFADPWLGLGALAFLLAAARLTQVPLLAIAVLAFLLWIVLTGGPIEAGSALPVGFQLPSLVLPEWPDLRRALELAVLPQIPLTVSNAIIVTAAVSASRFPGQAAGVDARKLSVSTGLMNLLLAPLGAMPMCHGAGGVVAQARFGARTGAAPVILGVVLLAGALFLQDGAAALLSAVPLPVAGALLTIAGAELAFSRRLLETRPECWPAIGLTAAVAAVANPALALLAGLAIEAGRRYLGRLRRSS